MFPIFIPHFSFLTSIFHFTIMSITGRCCFYYSTFIITRCLQGAHARVNTYKLFVIYLFYVFGFWCFKFRFPQSYYAHFSICKNSISKLPFLCFIFFYYVLFLNGLVYFFKCSLVSFNSFRSFIFSASNSFILLASIQ
jgi:hypothetical protein